ncbi:YndJ family transporter [Ammoniphilus sp. CFH 90114]|uniref:YndJ family transporter n=1 Tax=Ammoniphilus sp. CFH 90114 TaxID=2493665 RepID=UPI00100FD63A|nr:YndJ family transporter [Ammoniphilus sp. CFH 90114]RXT07076.1 hypothetical protein EIZ39_13065 [Ammoniphilus sp. CFH 90114]
MKFPYLPVVIGGIITMAAFTMEYFQFELIEQFLVFAFWVMVPLVLSLFDDKNQTKAQLQVHFWLNRLYFPAAFLAFASMMASTTWQEEHTMIPGALSMGWLFFTLLIAVYGLLILREKGFSSIEEVAIAAGLIYFFFGGIWYSLYQFEVHLFHLAPKMSALSAVHFHYSSSMVPIFIGMLGRVMEKKKWYQWLVVIDIVGPILIAFGILFSRTVEVIGVTIFAVNITIYSTYVLMKVRNNVDQRNARIFLSISSLAVYAIMLVGLAYGINKKLGLFPISVADMVLVYGTLHAGGFVLCGLLGWLAVKPGVKA